MEMLIGIIALVVMICLGVSIPASFAMVVFYLFLTLGGSAATTVAVGFSSTSSSVLMAIPLFIVAGAVINRGKMGSALVDFIEMFSGKSKEKLGIASVVAMAVFGSISGSSSATLSCISPILYPRMLKSGYERGYTAALHLCASPLGLLIPPSAAQILYAWSTGQSVLACFLSTIIPGTILAVFLCLINHFYVKGMGDQITVAEQAPIFSAMGGKRTLTAVPALLFPVIVLGGIYTGVMTPTEAAAISTLYAIPVCIYFYKGMRWKDIPGIFVESGTTNGVVLIMMFIIMIFSRYIVMEDIPNLIADFVFSISDNRYFVLLMANLFMILCGMIMDDTSALLLCSSLLLPMVTGAGVNPVQFAAIVGVNIGMGSITPPTAAILYMGIRVTGAPLKDVIGPTLRMIFFAYIPTLIITTFIPEISLFLPKLFGFV